MCAFSVVSHREVMETPAQKYAVSAPTGTQALRQMATDVGLWSAPVSGDDMYLVSQNNRTTQTQMRGLTLNIQLTSCPKPGAPVKVCRRKLNMNKL